MNGKNSSFYQNRMPGTSFLGGIQSVSYFDRFYYLQSGRSEGIDENSNFEEPPKKDCFD